MDLAVIALLATQRKRRPISVNPKGHQSSHFNAVEFLNF